jgi:ABC-type taurine transport system ATPase subunit
MANPAGRRLPERRLVFQKMILTPWRAAIVIWAQGVQFLICDLREPSERVANRRVTSRVGLGRNTNWLYASIQIERVGLSLAEGNSIMSLHKGPLIAIRIRFVHAEIAS